MAGRAIVPGKRNRDGSDEVVMVRSASRVYVMHVGSSTQSRCSYICYTGQHTLSQHCLLSSTVCHHHFNIHTYLYKTQRKRDSETAREREKESERRRAKEGERKKERAKEGERKTESERRRAREREREREREKEKRK